MYLLLDILLKKIINIVGKGSMDILVDSNDTFVKIVFSSIKDESNSQITLDVVKSMNNDPEIILYREEMIDLGGDIQFTTKKTNPVILIIIPTYKKIKMTAEIPELKNLFYNVREINTRV